MGKIVKNGIVFSGSSNSADRIKYDNTKNVKEAIDALRPKTKTIIVDSASYKNGVTVIAIQTELQSINTILSAIPVINNSNAIISLRNVTNQTININIYNNSPNDITAIVSLYLVYL